jgi:hypothetical protein
MKTQEVLKIDASGEIIKGGKKGMTEEQKEQLVEAMELKKTILNQVDMLLQKSVIISMSLAFQLDMMVKAAYLETVGTMEKEEKIERFIKFAAEKGWGKMVTKEDTQVFQSLTAEDFK